MPPCTWPVDRTCLPDVTATEDHVKLQAAVDAAVFVLNARTAGQFGQCPVIARPCPQQRETWDRTSYALPGVGWIPVLNNGVWHNEAFTCIDRRCTTIGPSVVRLPGPVASITAVKIDGLTLAASSYALEGELLYRTSGEWPSQNLLAPAGGIGTWTVEYLRGYAPPPGAATMVGMLALEFWKACQGKGCKLPARTQSVARQGITVTMPDLKDLLVARSTGIPAVDRWLAAINPHGHTQPPRVLSPDYPGIS